MNLCFYLHLKDWKHQLLGVLGALPWVIPLGTCLLLIPRQDRFPPPWLPVSHQFSFIFPLQMFHLLDGWILFWGRLSKPLLLLLN